MDSWTEIGTGGIFALLILKIVFDFLSGRAKNRIDWQKMARQTDDLYRLHAKTDSDGVPVWYVRRSLEDSIDKLASAITEQTKLLGQMTMSLQGQGGALERMEKKLGT